MPIIPFADVLPRVAPDCFVAPNAFVIGDVEIGAGSSVWFGTVIRGDVFHIRIGARVNIQDNSVVHVSDGRHATVIGDGVTIGHRAIIHGCTIGPGALIGMGAIVMDRAVIGARSIVAAGALVAEGMVVPEGTIVVGAPARPRRKLTEADLRHLESSAEGYAQLGATYAARLGFGHGA